MSPLKGARRVCLVLGCQRKLTGGSYLKRYAQLLSFIDLLYFARISSQPWWMPAPFRAM